MTTRNILLALTIGLLFSIKTYGQDIHIHNIYFPNNETEINKKDSDILNSFMDSIEVSVNCTISIVGFADNLGDEKLNYTLSEKRAISVKSYLLSKGILADNITANASGPVLDPNKNKTENERQFNRRVEVKISCALDKKEELKSIGNSIPNFENDTVIKGAGGTELKIKKGAFYPQKIKDITIEIKDLTGYCDSLPEDVEMATENGVCLESGGMAFISATYKKKPTKKSFENAFEVKIPIQNNDTTMDFYIAVRPKNGGKLRWRKANGKIISENGKKYYTYETNFLGGFNCDKVVGNCNVDSKDFYIIKTWLKYSSTKYYLKNKFAFFTAKQIGKRRIAIPAKVNPNDIYFYSKGYKLFSFRYFGTALFETKKIYTLSDLEFNGKKNYYKLKAKHYKPRQPKSKENKLKELMNCN